MHRSFQRLTYVMGLAAILAVQAPRHGFAQDGRAAADQPVTKGLRVFSCGHSFHQFVVPILSQMAASAGIQGHEIAGRSSIGGSRVIQHWEVPDEKNLAKQALRAGRVDVLTLSPIWLPDEGIEKFARLAFEHNPQIRITVQEFWLPNDTYEPKYPLDTRKKVDHDATNLVELQSNQDRYDRDVDEYVSAVNQRLGKDVIVTVPVGQAAIMLRQKIVTNQAPGLSKQWDLFRDNWGHPQMPLRLLSGYCHFAVIYRRSPIGLPLPPDLAKAETMTDDDKVKLNRLLQEVAWNAVTSHAQSGVSAAADSRAAK